MRNRGQVTLAVSLALGTALSTPVVSAEALDLQQAVERALNHDPRIEERHHLATAAEALLQEAEGYRGWMVQSNSFLAVAPQAEGDMFVEGSCAAGNCTLRDDRYDVDGLTPWFNVQVALIKPLYTFGKIENYADAARENIRIKQQDVRLQQGETIINVKQAYYGYLAARDGRLLLDDVIKRVEGATELVQGWLDEGEGDAKQSDLYALQAARGLVARYRAQAAALEGVALDGLRVLTGVGLGQPLDVADRRIQPVELPDLDVERLRELALVQRPEMQQLAAGLKARRSLVEAHKSEAKPDIYAGVAGMLSNAPGRDRLENPFIYDPFNEAGVSPMLGMRWNWTPGVADAKTAGARAELNALIAKNSFAQQGIPFQVVEQVHQVQGHYDAVLELEQATRAARRWMIASYTDFEAGLEKADKVMTAFQAYVLAASDYLQMTYEYNMRVARLQQVTGEQL